MIKETKYLYWAVLSCGALPLVVGTSIFLLWVTTRGTWLGQAGIYTILGGLLLFALGTCGLIDYWRRGWRSPEYPRPKLWFRTLLAAGLLLANFPAAAVIIGAVGVILTRCVLIVENTAPLPFTEARLSGVAELLELGTIPPGGSVKRSFKIKRGQEGALELRGLLGTEKLEQTIEEYATGGLGDTFRVKIRPDGVIERLRTEQPSSSSSQSPARP